MLIFFRPEIKTGPQLRIPVPTWLSLNHKVHGQNMYNFMSFTKQSNTIPDNVSLELTEELELELTEDLELTEELYSLYL